MGQYRHQHRQAHPFRHFALHSVKCNVLHACMLINLRLAKKRYFCESKGHESIRGSLMNISVYLLKVFCCTLFVQRQGCASCINNICLSYSCCNLYQCLFTQNQQTFVNRTPCLQHNASHFIILHVSQQLHPKYYPGVQLYVISWMSLKLNLRSCT